MAHNQEGLIPVDQAIEQLAQALPLLPTEKIDLAQALGRVLAEPIHAPHPLPPFDHSAMDGFAAKSEDLVGASNQSPVNLEVVGEVAAGHIASERLASGQAARITTGAPLPSGADCVVPVELTANPAPMAGADLAASVQIQQAVAAGEYVRRAGLDIKAGDQLLPTGHRLRPQDIGLLAAAGIAQPMVRRVARVAVISTGDEVIEIDRPLEPGLIRDSNGMMLMALLQANGADPIRLGIAQDERAAVKGHLDRAVEQGADLILSSAGVSMGAHDYVRLILEEHGRLSFWRVNVRPGKPLAHGSYRDVPFIGLPGNPVSAWVTFSLFVRPALAAMSGQPRPYGRTVTATLQEQVESDGRESYLRVILTKDASGFQARLTGSQDSAVLSSLVKANGLMIIPAGTERLPAGSQVEVWLMGDHGLVEVTS